MNIFELFEHGASEKEIIEAIKKLNDVNIKNKHSCSFLHFACLYSNIEVAKFLVENGANVKNDFGRTPLYEACCHDRLEVAKFLIEHDADIEIKDNLGWTPLHYAHMCCNTEFIKLLIENNIDTKEEFEYCFEHKDIKRIKLLTKSGACFL